MNFLLTVTRFLAIVVLPLAVVSVGSQGLVGCFGSDGTFALEAGCSCSPDDQDSADGASRSAIVSVPAGGGADCFCLPLSSEWQTTVSSSKQSFYPKAALPQPNTSRALAYPDPASISWDTIPKTIEQLPPFLHLALRTVVLQT